MFKIRFLFCFVPVFLLCFAEAGEKDIPDSRYGGKLDPRPVPVPVERPAPAHEMRGVWVATVSNMDFTPCKTVDEFCQQARSICQTLHDMGANAVFFQVRPCNDAFYASKLNPWSRFLTGKEGVALTGKKNFDPLEFLIDEAHRNGLEFHAWLNPYRVVRSTSLSKEEYLKTLAPDNFARLNPDLVVSTPNGKAHYLMLDPAEPRVRKFVADTVMELVKNYAVDGIHFDDYFYPGYMPAELDAAQFKKYNRKNLSLEDWRRENVTELVRLLHKEIARFNRGKPHKVRFGISPFGIWRNRTGSPLGSLTGDGESYISQRADTRLWVKEKIIDYIAPQQYWHFGHATAAYAALNDWWCETVRGTGVDLYIGQALLCMGSRGWDVRQLYYQLMYNRNKPEIKGSIIFSYRNIAKPSNGIMKDGGVNMLKAVWNMPQGQTPAWTPSAE